MPVKVSSSWREKVLAVSGRGEEEEAGGEGEGGGDGDKQEDRGDTTGEGTVREKAVLDENSISEVCV